MTYEYVCEACGHQWEAEQSIKERPLRDCSACGKSTAKRLVSGGTGFLLKGGGWYADLYSSSSGSKSASSTEKTESKSESSAPAESKDATATSSKSSNSATSSSSSTTAAASAKAG